MFWSMDALDAKLVTLLTRESGISIVECARRLGVARVTVQSRLSKLQASGIVQGIVPKVNPEAMGYGLLAICALQIEQRRGHGNAAAEIAAIPEVIDLYTVTGGADMHAKVVAHSTHDLQRVIDVLSQVPGISRVSSQIVLDTHFSNRCLPLVQQAGQ